jgi:hypothetical protein
MLISIDQENFCKLLMKKTSELAILQCQEMLEDQAKEKE